jgi:tetratricopeptide (TPR) repeat protein
LVLGCVVVVGGPALYAWQQARAAASLAEALSVSEGRRAQAQANLRAARHAVDRLLTRVSEEVLFEQPHMLPVRRALLEDAVDVYAGLARGAPEDPDLRREAARAQVRIARIAPMLGRSADAVEALAAAISAYDALGDPDQGTRLEIAAAHAQRAALLRATGRVQEATAAFSEALRIGSALVDGPGRDDPAVLAFAVTTRFELMLLRLGQDRPDDVRAEIAVAEGLIARWESTSGPNWASKQALANVLRAKGMLAGREGDREAATAHFRRASALWDELVREKPDSVQGRIGAAEALTMLGRYLGETQGPVAAMPTLERAEASWADLETSFRDWLRIRVGHSTNLRALAEAQFHAGSPEARSAFERVVARQREIVVGYPDDLNAPEDLAKALRGLAGLEARSGRVEEAATALREAIALWRALSQRQPERPDLLANLGLDLAAVGSMLAQAGDGAAVAALEEAVVRQRAAMAAASGAPVHQSWLVHHYRLVIDLHLQDGRTGDAVRLARAILGDPLTTPEGPLLAANVFARCAGIAREAADSRPDEGRSDEALWVREGLDSLARAIELGFADVLELQRAPGLARLRDEPRFQELVERARTGRRRH